MWLVLGLPRRHPRLRVPGSRRPGQRPPGRDRGGSGRGARPAGVRRSGSSAVRLLHTRADRCLARPSPPDPGSDRRRHPRGPGGQRLPLHRLRQDHPGRSRGGATMRVGESVRRPDGGPKVRGTFVYSSDLRAEGMLWGATVRSPHPSARIVSIDTSAAHAMPGIQAVLTHEDVPGKNLYGLEFEDQPVLAGDFVRYWGEAVALVAAEHPEQARRAAEKVQIEYEVLKPVTTAEAALAPHAPELHPGGNLLRHVKIRHGDQSPQAEVVVKGTYVVGMQDQAPLGPESGL